MIYMKKNKQTSSALLRVLVGSLYFLGFSGYYIILLTVFRLWGAENSRLVTIPFRILYIGLAISVIVVAVRSRVYGISKYALLLAGTFWALWHLRLILDALFQENDLSITFLEYIQRTIGITIVPMLGFVVMMRNDVSRLAFWAVALSSACFCIMAYYFYADLLTYGEYRVLHHHGVDRSTLISPLTISYTGTLLASLALWRFASYKDTIWVRSLTLGLLTLGFYVSMIGSTRGSLIVIIIVYAILIVTNLLNRNSFGKILLIGLAGGVTYLVSAFTSGGGATMARFSTLFEQVEYFDQEAGSGRLEIYKDAIAQFVSSPLLGSSIEENVTRSYPHNIVIEAFMATGVFGGLVFCIILILGGRIALRLLSTADPRSWIAIVFINFAVMGMVSGSIIAPGFWYSWFALMGLKGITGDIRAGRRWRQCGRPETHTR